MMDGVFKIPEMPASGGSKRKLPSSSSSHNQDASKRPRTSNNHTSDPLANPSKIPSRPNGGSLAQNGNGATSIPVGYNQDKGKGRAATVEDEPEEQGPKDVRMGDEEEEDDGAYGVAEETFEADDGDEEGGRFFGGGTNETQEVSPSSIPREHGLAPELISTFLDYGRCWSCLVCV